MRNFNLKLQVKLVLLVYLSTFFCQNSFAQNRWELDSGGKIVWKIKDRLPHSDHIEMSGDSISVILNYTVNPDRSFKLERKLVWPMLRTIPNNTHASLIRLVNDDCLEKVLVNGKSLQSVETSAISLNGLMEIKIIRKG